LAHGREGRAGRRRNRLGYDFADGLGAPMLVPRRVAEITSAHRGLDRTGAIVDTNMSASPLNLAGWSILIDAETNVALPEVASFAPRKPSASRSLRARSTMKAAY
jgi:hypothetical protein